MLVLHERSVFGFPPVFWMLILNPCLGLSNASAAESVPTDALRASICLNGQWEIAPADDEMKMPESGWTAARVPAIPIVDKSVKAQWHRLALDAPKEWGAPDRRFFLELEKVGHYAAVFCNGQKMGEHYGQYTPFEFDVTDAFKPGEKNVIAIYVHNASGRYVRPNADITDEMICNAYRPATQQADQRNWIGVGGDITLSWRPQTRFDDVFVETSVREKSIKVSTHMAAPAGADSPLSVRATVLDGEKAVLELPAQSAGAEGKVELSATWENPVLWGTPPYGKPKLYTLRAELLRGDQVVDREFTRFGFREVWIDGKDVMLNGKKLWMAGTYHSKLPPVRCLNDRRPFEAMTRAMQLAGLNSLHGHWDDLGRPWLDVCDETGMFVLGGFFCDGRPQIQSTGEAEWTDWMAATTAEWVRARRNHPSILLWRPTDVLPNHQLNFISREDFVKRIAEAVRANDPSKRPLADDSDVSAWGQSPTGKQGGTELDYSFLERGGQRGTPFLCKEIYGGVREPGKMEEFLRTFYEKSFAVGSTGMFVQQLPIIAWGRPDPFEIQWLSASGLGNRDTKVAGLWSEMPNWCDPKQPAAPQAPAAKLFHELFQQYMKVDLEPLPGALSGEALASGLAPNSIAFLTPAAAAVAEPQGLLVAPDGSAWFVAQPGTWRLVSGDKGQEIEIKPTPANPPPGYEDVQRMKAP
ncbi:MAG: hypothetical protein NTW86_02935 [Candidatus Sumerlaeota bacterium]|nr:hypothetical protein [Candidatus Sumerlaeota bacterium]